MAQSNVTQQNLSNYHTILGNMVGPGDFPLDFTAFSMGLFAAFQSLYVYFRLMSEILFIIVQGGAKVGLKL